MNDIAQAYLEKSRERRWQKADARYELEMRIAIGICCLGFGFMIGIAVAGYGVHHGWVL